MRKQRNKNADNGFVPIRRGIYEHISDGLMGGKEWMVYSVLHLKADHETGICYKISGPALAYLLGEKPHYINRLMRSLEKKGYIKRMSFRGQVACYPVAINKFLTSNGILIDARNSKSLNEIAWYVEKDCTITVFQRSFKCISNVFQVSCLQEIKKLRIKQESKPRTPKTFTPPTLDQVKGFVGENPELANVDPDYFWKVFTESDWIDTKGNPVKNWKLKLRTWSRFDCERKENKKDETKKIGGNNTPPKPFVR